MAISNTLSNSKEVVFIQRNDDNTQYDEVHISGSSVIPYIDENGYLTADNSTDFYTKFPPPSGSNGGTSLITGSTYPITASFSETSSTSILPYNGNRTIKRTPYTSLNVGGDTLEEFIENFFFPFVPSTVAISSGGITYFETGSSQNFSISSTITINDEITFGSSSIYKDSVQWNTTGSPTPASFTFTDNSIISNHTYQTFVQTDNDGNPTIISSNTKTATFLYPFFYGTSSTVGLKDNTLYTTLTKQIRPKENKTYSINGTTTYIYIAYPSSYSDLVHIYDPNLFDILTSFEYSASVPITSSGLSVDWSSSYKVYRLKTLADPSGNYEFNFS